MPVPAGPPGLDVAVVDITRNLLTLAECHEAINLDSAVTDLDNEITRFNTAVSRRIDDLCGPVVARTVTAEVHDGGGSIILREWPVLSVTSVSEWSSGTQTVLAAETLAASTNFDYALDVRTGVVRRRSGWADSRFVSGQANVVVTYTAGRYSMTSTVDPKFKVAAASILRRLFKREQGAWAQNPAVVFDVEPGTLAFFNAVDKVVDELLGLERKPPAVG